ncbi:hypothetical protein [Dactylosporangium sp. NPDC049140]|uniref:hypothetical protein n=1 Tax=Dactylosporangium sp. NPDC049140 TaxID=3155647 RepID=UPI0033FFF5E8
MEHRSGYGDEPGADGRRRTGRWPGQNVVSSVRTVAPPPSAIVTRTNPGSPAKFRTSPSGSARSRPSSRRTAATGSA